jgi:hypothetical protein
MRRSLAWWGRWVFRELSGNLPREGWVQMKKGFLALAIGLLFVIKMVACDSVTPQSPDPVEGGGTGGQQNQTTADTPNNPTTPTTPTAPKPAGEVDATRPERSGEKAFSTFTNNKNHTERIGLCSYGSEGKITDDGLQTLYGDPVYFELKAGKTKTLTVPIDCNWQVDAVYGAGECPETTRYSETPDVWWNKYNLHLIEAANGRRDCPKDEPKCESKIDSERVYPEIESAPQNGVALYWVWFHYKATKTAKVCYSWGDGTPEVCTGTMEDTVSHGYTMKPEAQAFTVTFKAIDGRGEVCETETHQVKIPGKDPCEDTYLKVGEQSELMDEYLQTRLTVGTNGTKFEICYESPDLNGCFGVSPDERKWERKETAYTVKWKVLAYQGDKLCETESGSWVVEPKETDPCENIRLSVKDSERLGDDFLYTGLSVTHNGDTFEICYFPEVGTGFCTTDNPSNEKWPRMASEYDVDWEVIVRVQGEICAKETGSFTVPEKEETCELPEQQCFVDQKPWGKPANECGRFGMVPITKVQGSGEDQCVEAAVDADLAIVKSGNDYHIIPAVQAGDKLCSCCEDTLALGLATVTCHGVSHVTYCECPPIE